MMLDGIQPNLFATGINVVERNCCFSGAYRLAHMRETNANANAIAQA